MKCNGRRSEDCSACPNRFVHDYFAVNAGTTLKSTTGNTYLSHFDQFEAYLRQHDLSTLEAEREDVVHFIELCVRKGNRRGTLGGKLTAVTNLYRHIRLRMNSVEELALDPIELDTIDLQQYNTPEPVEREALSREELRKLFDGMRSYRNRLLAITGAETGLRNSDLRSIRLSDIDLEELLIHVHDPKNSKPYDVPISEELSFEFRQWVDHHRGGYATAETSKYLFPSQDGHKLKTNGGLNEIIKAAADRAGIQEVIGTSVISPEQREVIETKKDYRDLHRVTVHTLRHTFLTMLKDAEVPLPYRQLVANHSNPSTTMEYTHGSNDLFETVREKFDPPR